MSLPRQVTKYVELELQQYGVSKLKLDERAQYLPSNVLLSLTNTVSAIGRVLDRLPEEYRALQHLHFERGRSAEWCAAELHMDRSTVYRMKRKLIDAVATELGLTRLRKMCDF
jgi:RinA family phage transcriptional activator